MLRRLMIFSVLSVCSGTLSLAQEEASEPEWSGTFVPVGGAAVSVDAPTVPGGLTFVEVADHGAPVDKGDLLGRFETEKIDDAIEAAEIALESATIARDHAEWNARLDVEKEAVALARASLNLGRARKSLEGWEKHGLEFKRRDTERGLKHQRNSIDDQQDELSQLEAMYREDELTDETEEIVLARARRSLAMSVDSLKMSEARRKYRAEYEDPIQEERKHEAVADAELALEHLKAKTEMAGRSREDALKKTARGFEKAAEKLATLKEERDRFRVVAPRAGVALHGAADDYRPGGGARRYEAGSTAKANDDLFTIIEDGFAIALDLPEADLSKLRQGIAVQVNPVFAPEHSLLGRMNWERFPSPGGKTNTFRATVELDGRLPGVVPGMRVTVTPARGGSSGGSDR